MKQKNILILGGFGFIGRNIAEELLKGDAYNVIVFDRDDDPFSGAGFDREVIFCKGDFTNSADIEQIFKQYPIDIVIHSVSTTVPGTCHNDIAYDISSNLISTVKVLDLMHAYGVPRIVFLSSGGTVYGLPGADNPEGLFSEQQHTNPISSYGIVKLAIEKYLEVYRRLYGIEYLVLRESNPYGRYHRSDIQGLINVMLKKAIRNEPITIWGDGTVVRDYMHVSDCAQIVRALIERDVVNEVINLGSGVGHTVNDIIAAIRNIAGDMQVEYKESRNADVPRVVLDVSKLRALVDHHPIGLEDGIRDTYQWLRTTLS